MTIQTRFVLLTAAKNEDKYIEGAIRSVVCQTALPLVWFIIDDGSTDRTAQIVGEFAKAYPFIRLISSPSGGERSFGARYRAINRAYVLACGLDFEFIAVQDADVKVSCRIFPGGASCVRFQPSSWYFRRIHRRASRQTVEAASVQLSRLRRWGDSNVPSRLLRRDGRLHAASPRRRGLARADQCETSGLEGRRAYNTRRVSFPADV